MRVLLVEDDVGRAAAMHRALRGAGVVADVSATGDDALWMVRAGTYDAMVLDVMLPDIDGFETCRLLRADGVWVPIIMVTARDAVEDRVRGLDAGADDYLTKPRGLRRAVCAGPRTAPPRQRLGRSLPPSTPSSSVSTPRTTTWPA